MYGKVCFTSCKIHMEELNIRGMIKKSSRSDIVTSSHYTDIYTWHVDTDNLLKITDRVARGFTQIKWHDKTHFDH
jgi:hypothetical protein